MLVILRILLLINIVSLQLPLTFTQNLPPIACPHLFQYHRDDSGIFGVLTVAQLEIGNSEIKMTFSQRGLRNSNYYGAITPYPTEETTIRNVLAQKAATFRVDFPDSDNIPKVIHISVNGMKLCSDQKYPDPSSWLELQYTLLTFFTNTNGGKQYSSPFGGPQVQIFNIDQPPPSSVPTTLFRPITQEGAPDTSQIPVSSVPSNKFTPITQRMPFGSQSPGTTLSSAVPSNKFMPIQPQQWPGTSQAPATTLSSAAVPSSRFMPIQQQQWPGTSQAPATTLSSQVPSNKFMPIQQQQWPGTSQIPSTSFVPVEPAAAPTESVRRRSASAPRAPSIRSRVSRNPTCGKEGAVIRHLLLGGVELGRGQFPWLTAIYRKTTGSLTFVCGGSLVSQRTIITAAHCFQSLTASQFVVYLGKHDLLNFTEEGMETREVRELIVHSEYRQNQPDADIAILHVDPLESYTQFINVVCLWSETVDISYIVDSQATVAGWGRDENGNAVSPLAKMTDVSIVSDDVCTRSSPSFRPLLTDRTFCAGNLDGSGPCMGDSGSGLMMFRDGKWVLRGIVSAGQGTQRQCDLYTYVIYCDLAKHIDWVRQNL